MKDTKDTYGDSTTGAKCQYWCFRTYFEKQQNLGISTGISFFKNFKKIIKTEYLVCFT